MAQRLKDMQIGRVSLVDKGANQRSFAIFKRADEEGGLIDRIAKGVADLLHLPGAGGDTHYHLEVAGREQIAKATRTFNDLRASAELNEELPEAFYTLQDAIWGAMWAYDDDGQLLSLEARKALVATDLEQFKDYALALLDAGLAKRDAVASGPAALIDGLIAKVGRKISAARLSRLKEAASALTDVLAEVEAADDTATQKRDSTQEEDMTPDELTTAVTKGIEPLVTRVEAIEKRLPAEPAAPAPATPAPAEPAATVAKADSDGEVTLADVAEAVNKLADRVEKVETAPGQPTAIQGQDGPTGPVRKSKGFGAVFGIGH